jgi:hypothetical protein
MLCIEEALYDDKMRTQADKFPRLLDILPVLLYQVLLPATLSAYLTHALQGQFDWKDGSFANEAWIRMIDWPDREVIGLRTRAECV